MKDTDQWLPDFDDPDDLTPEERLSRIVHILALGAIRLADSEKNKPVLKANIDSPKLKGYAHTS